MIAFIISVLLIPTLLFAQGDLTLEGLAEQITSLTERITKLEAIHTTVTVDGYCKLPDDIDHLDPEAESKWEALTGEETLTSYRRELSSMPISRKSPIIIRNAMTETTMVSLFTMIATAIPQLANGRSCQTERKKERRLYPNWTGRKGFEGTDFLTRTCIQED